MAGQPLSRRQVLGIGAAAVAATVLVPGSEAAASPGAVAQTADSLRPTIRPRTDWAGELGVKGELVPEDDVRFLLVHHTASTNEYRPEDVADQIRGFYQFHTGPDKGWPDVAYNFFVDRYGGIWEGRQGSIDGPVRGDATGGSQGFALLCSLIGNHQEGPVTTEQQAGLVQLLAWLGETYAVDTTPGTLTTFISRGSNRWPVGAEVTTATISGHRDMSTTTCPGDFAYPLLAQEIPSQVSALRPLATERSTSSTTASSTEGTADSSPTDSSLGDQDAAASPDPSSDSATASTSTEAPSTGAAATQTAEQAAAAVNTDAASDSTESWPLVIIGGVLGAVAAGAGLFTRLWNRADDSG